MEHTKNHAVGTSFLLLFLVFFPICFGLILEKKKSVAAVYQYLCGDQSAHKKQREQILFP